MNSSRPNYPNAWMNPRKEGEFVTEQRCSCPTSQLYAIKFNKVKCKLMNETNQGCEICCIGLLCTLFATLLMLLIGLAATRYDSAIILAIIVSSLCIIVLILYAVFSEFTHSALEALYKCRSCGHEVHKTYELLPQPFGCAGGDIFNDCGLHATTSAAATARIGPNNLLTASVERSNAMHFEDAMPMPLSNRTFDMPYTGSLGCDTGVQTLPKIIALVAPFFRP
uniref:Uncharacterized protein n=1 Tax=Globodera rostochiensis TaxID=31243 RepID=A0A914HR43_GLORO